MLILPYEELVADGRRFVEAIGRFAERPIPGEVLDALPFTRRSNEASSALAIEVSRPLSNVAKRLRASSMDVPGARPLVERKEVKLRELVNRTVGDRYVASNRRTAELTGLDLTTYGWMV